MKTKKKQDKWAGKTIKVDWKHIALGEPQESISCPIALALREQGARDVAVNTEEGITIGSRKYDIPGKAKTFIEAFDDNRTDVKPMEFKIGKLIEEDDDLGYDWDNIGKWL